VRSRFPIHWATRTAESLFAVLFPSDCRICHQPLVKISRLPVCEQCLAQIHPVGGKVCAVCGERVHAAYALPGAGGVICCPVCRRLSPPFAKAVAYGSYEGGLRELIHLLKYAGVRPAASVLGRMLAEAIAALEPEFSQAGFPRTKVGEPQQTKFSENPAFSNSADRTIAVVPVPLHKTKRRQRGFNQAELIARAALKSSAVSRRLFLLIDVLERRRETGSQIGLTAHQRRENLRGAFAVSRAEQIKGSEVLLVDDVLTTGATASECARVLLRAGATRVWVATVARTLKLASQYAEFAPQPAEPEIEEHAPLARAVGS
jgi:ComF family protein